VLRHRNVTGGGGLADEAEGRAHDDPDQQPPRSPYDVRHRGHPLDPQSNET
jgi:hypothetical protein